MSLKDQIISDIKTAMKAKKADKVSALRFLHSAVKNFEIELRPKEISDEDVMTVVKKQVKKHRDSIEQYEKAERADLANKEKFQLSVIETYLPEQLSPEKVEEIVEAVIASTGASLMKDMGLVMKAVMAETKGAADNKTISQIIKAKLQK